MTEAKEQLFPEDLYRNKTVVVTGAGRGIGYAVASAFSHYGATVIAHTGRRRSASIFHDRSITSLEADFTDQNETAGFVDEVLKRTNAIDVLVNNAGTMHGRFLTNNLTDQQYNDLVMLNQSSVVTITRGLLDCLKNSTAGSIVNTVSISARTGGSPGSSIYSATKAFVSTYTKSLAKELAPFNIRANAVSPGTIDTDFHQRYSTREKLKSTEKSVPLQRLGTPEDCAPAYIFLGSNSHSGYITGQIIEINGGQLIA